MDLVDVASKEIGYKEGANSYTKYGSALGINYVAWCSLFVTWCSQQAGIKEHVPQTASCHGAVSWFKNKGRFKLNTSDYIPKRNDLVYFDTEGGGHVAIVKSYSNGVLYTIDGNYSDSVCERTYKKDGSTRYIYGYGVVSDYIQSSSGSAYYDGSSGDSNNSEKSKEEKRQQAKAELATLNRVLSRKNAPVTVKNVKLVESTKMADVLVKMVVFHDGEKLLIDPQDGMELSYERSGTPGKLTFKVLKDKKLKIGEGDEIQLVIDGKKVFRGFVFTKSKTKENIWSVTCYNQLRYLKNKDDYFYKNKTVDALVRMIAKDYNLRVGTLDNTKVQISRNEEGATLFDIINTAIEETLMTTGELYILYDNFGKLMLKNISEMKLPHVVSKYTAGDFDYSSSIDSDTYNKVKLVYENDETGKLDVYIAKDSKNISKWGLLQYHDKIEHPMLGKVKSNALLKYYNKKKRKISIKDQIGNTDVVAGSMIPVFLDLGDVKIKNYMLVEKVTHKFSNREHKMDLILSGGKFSV